MSRSLTGVLTVFGAALVLLAAAGPAQTASPSKAPPAKAPPAVPKQCVGTTLKPAAEGAKGLNEIGPSARRPTFDVALNDDGSLEDEAGLSPRSGTRFKDPGKVSAELIDPPSDGPKGLKGKLAVAANVNPSNTRVRVSACIYDVRGWGAGRYEGNILISGPRFADFTYPVVVTRRWPAWFAGSLLVVAAAAFILFAYLSGSLVFKDDLKGRRWLGSIVFILVALVAIVPVYFSSYENSATWGENPGVEVVALIAAGVTAATAGLAAARKATKREED